MKKLFTATLAIALMLGATSAGTATSSSPPTIIFYPTTPIIVKPEQSAAFLIAFDADPYPEVDVEVYAPLGIIRKDNVSWTFSENSYFYRIKDVGKDEGIIEFHVKFSNIAGEKKVIVKIIIQK